MINEKILVIYSVANGSVCPEWAYIVVVCIFILVTVTSLCLSVFALVINVKKKQPKEYWEGYIKGADDRKNDTCPSVSAPKESDYFRGYIAGHRDSKYWKK